MQGFRRVRWCAPLAVAVSLLALAVPAVQAQPLRFGFNAVDPRVGEDPQPLLGLQVEAGANLQRTGVLWRTVQPRQGMWDWTYVDDVIGRAAARGLQTIAVVAGVPPWAARGAPRQCLFNGFSEFCRPPPHPSRLGDFKLFVRRLAERYPSLAAIEVWNEPNLGDFNWQPQADPEYYTQVLRVANEAVDEVRPSLPVLSGGIGPPGVPPPPGSIGPGEFLRRMYAAGARGAMDGIALHPYPAGTSPEDPSTSVYHAIMSEMRAIRDGAGDTTVPFWITEVGYTTTGPYGVSLDQQARWLPALVLDSFARPDVAAVVVHTLRDGEGDPTDAEPGYGALLADLTPKPVFEALTRTVRVIEAERRPAGHGRARRLPARCRRRGMSTRTRRYCRCLRRGGSPRRCRRHLRRQVTTGRA